MSAFFRKKPAFFGKNSPFTKSNIVRATLEMVKLPLPYPLRFGLKFVLIHLNLYYAIRPPGVNTPYFLCINLHPTYYKFDNIQCIRGNNTIEIKTFLVNYIYYVFT